MIPSLNAGLARRFALIAGIGLLGAALVAAAGAALERQRFGASTEASFAKIENEVRLRFEASASTLATISARVVAAKRGHRRRFTRCRSGEDAVRSARPGCARRARRHDRGDGLRREALAARLGGTGLRSAPDAVRAAPAHSSSRRIRSGHGWSGSSRSSIAIDPSSAAPRLIVAEQRLGDAGSDPGIDDHLHDSDGARAGDGDDLARMRRRRRWSIRSGSERAAARRSPMPTSPPRIWRRREASGSGGFAPACSACWR